ncbi:MAG: tRNA preQ1(34) S-adenosylmethionine ribosyltransferase-isomerase QueA, partial [Deltaproteobacteria bacterium]
MELYDFPLPRSLIAQAPAPRRDGSRLLHLSCGKDGPRLRHLRFRQIATLLHEGDLLVLNDTKVVPARIFGRKPTGGKVE